MESGSDEIGRRTNRDRFFLNRCDCPLENVVSHFVFGPVCRLLVHLDFSCNAITTPGKKTELLSVVQQFSQALPGTVDRDADGIVSHAHPLAEFPMAPATKRMQIKHLGLPFRKF
jgi:hypothetical protein